MKLVRISAIGLVVFLTWVNLAVTQERPVPPKPPEADVSRAGYASLAV